MPAPAPPNLNGLPVITKSDLEKNDPTRLNRTFYILAQQLQKSTNGTVTSVALTMPSEFAVAGSPVTDAGTLAVTKATQSPNLVYAGPGSGVAAEPAFRALVTADLPAAGPGSGTVTSVGLSLPAILTVSGSPVTTAGTLSAVLANESANRVFAGPTSGGAAAPTFRALVAADIPGGVTPAWVAEVPSGTLNGSNLTFTLSFTPLAGSLDLIVNIEQVLGTDFTISTNTITFITAPKASDSGWFYARYQH